MDRKLILSALGFLSLLLVAFNAFGLQPRDSAALQAQSTLVLYDAAAGTVPSAPLMSFTDFPPGTAPLSYRGGATILDTTASSDTYAGWISNGANTPGFPMFDRSAGFQVNFTIQVEAESHANNHRAGFNIILLGGDARGIELAFWQDEIWAQSDDATGGLFQHGEGVAFATTSGPIQYQLTILGDHYGLSVGTEPILSGPLRDYSAFDGFPDPYQTPNFLFLGDNTTSAQARVRLAFVSVTGTPPIAVTSTTVTAAPTGSPTAQAGNTPASPSPTSPDNGFRICPPSGVLILMIVIGIAARKTRGRFAGAIEKKTR